MRIPFLLFMRILYVSHVSVRFSRLVPLVLREHRFLGNVPLILREPW